MNRSWCACLLVLAVFTRGAYVRAAEERPIDYARQIRPILVKNCFSCHGPDDDAREAELRLDRAEAAYEAEAIVPGKPDESELVARITSDDADLLMPPAESKKTLTPEQIELLRRWIEQGAKYDRHWAFVAPQKPPLPGVENRAWPKNAIDQFVLRRLEQAGLQPSPPADRYTLIRRVSLDLIGLPPSPEEADAFVNDKRPDAYERVVDRLLSSPHYGERWTRAWLDLARYSDTNGYEKDQPRTMWPYRDWVINALNADMPFDQFTIKQIAGDMLPGATQQDLIATGFHRNTMINEEGGIDPMEFRFYAQVDRVATTGTVWLGLTVGCTQCHSHKYDPLQQTEFYRMMSFYDQADDLEYDVADEEIADRRAEIDRQITALKSDLAKHYPAGDGKQTPAPENTEELAQRRQQQLQQDFEVWKQSESAKAADWTVLRPTQLQSSLPILSVLEDQSVLSCGDYQKSETFDVTCRAGPRTITAIRLEAIPHESLPNNGPGRGSISASVEQKGRFLLTDFSITADGKQIAISSASESFAHKESNASKALDDDLQSGWANNGNQGKAAAAVYQLAEPLVLTEETDLVFRLHCEAFYPSGLGRFRLSATDKPAQVVATGHSAEIEAILAQPAETRTADHEQQLLQRFLLVAPKLKDQHEQIEKLRKERPRFVRTLVIKQRDADQFRQTTRHHRGEYLQPREPVRPGVFGILHQLPQGAEPNRMALAKWLASPQNPLVARVTMNRDWAALFGQGLVRTLDDFGVQGEPPTHPGLLDWLAVEFIERGWSRKQMHRLIVTSATYRQSSQVTPKLLEQDPQNRLLSRGPRYRLDAELIRDVVLKISGQLSPKIGGPSVFPPQPPGITEGAYGPLKWNVSSGEDRYRRGLYTFNKRTAPYAMFSTFDAPSGELCVARRDRSNTPLQALMLLNDEIILDAARALTDQAINLESDDVAERAKSLFRRCVIRPPDEAELTALIEFYQSQLARFSGGELNPRKTIGASEKEPVESLNDRAAWTAVARVLLNLDETITKD